MGFAQGIVSMIVFYFLVLQTMVCFARVVNTNPGRPKDLADKGLPSMQSGQTKTGKMMRMCNKCQCYKPDRCHHCSDCQACTLKMDHHCPWVNNCVGFNNYKYFVLFLIYGSISCAYTIGLLVYAILIRPKEELEAWEISSIINLVLVGFFGLGAFGLMCYHMSLMLSNQTTIEQLKSGNPDEYSLGITENVRQVLGSSTLVWCIPCVWGVSPSYDGVEWGRPEEGAPTGTEMNRLNGNGTDTSLQARPPSPPIFGSGANGHSEQRPAAVGDIAVIVESGGANGNGTAIGQLVKAVPYNGAGDLVGPGDITTSIPPPPPARNIGML